MQAMKDWHKLKPDLFKKQPYYLTGCDNYALNLACKCTPTLLTIQRVSLGRVIPI